MTNLSTLEIESAAYDAFLLRGNQGEFDGQRLGQAFYQHFRLHRISDQAHLYGLYEADGKKALKVISKVFQIK